MNDFAGILSSELPDWCVTELRTDHAGETGAVYIYRGILALSNDSDVRSFAKEHLTTEQEHLRLIDACLPPAEQSRLLPLWRLAGWLTGAIPALFGPRAVFATVAAVETFVDEHYGEQITRLQAEQSAPKLLALLESCREDELHHRDEAQALLNSEPGWLLRAWCAVVDSGSRAAVTLARHI